MTFVNVMFILLLHRRYVQRSHMQQQNTGMEFPQPSDRKANAASGVTWVLTK
jgi:hypothetical protein